VVANPFKRIMTPQNSIKGLTIANPSMQEYCTMSTLDIIITWTFNGVSILSVKNFILKKIQGNFSCRFNDTFSIEKSPK